MLMWVQFNNLIVNFQFVKRCSFTDSFIGIDGISLFFIILTTFIMPLCILSIWNEQNNVVLYVICLLVLESLLLLAFSVLTLF
jgi:NADH:ubiquinone oxidoreductase subunit 4 (subunit M)